MALFFFFIQVGDKNYKNKINAERGIENIIKKIPKINRKRILEKTTTTTKTTIKERLLVDFLFFYLFFGLIAIFKTSELFLSLYCPNSFIKKNEILA